MTIATDLRAHRAPIASAYPRVEASLRQLSQMRSGEVGPTAALTVLHRAKRAEGAAKTTPRRLFGAVQDFCALSSSTRLFTGLAVISAGIFAVMVVASTARLTTPEQTVALLDMTIWFGIVPATLIASGAWLPVHRGGAA